MEPFTFDSGKLKGVEVLYFDDVEVQKVKGNSTSFSSMGPLSVLYFKNYDRFVLRLNGWTYPLFRRIPITSTGTGGSKTYELPAPNGFTYRLNFNNASGHAFSNFESILSNSTRYGDRKLSASPDDRVVRKASGHKEGPTVAGLVKSGVEKVKETAKELTGPAKKKPLAKKRMMPGSIKNRNFRKGARATFKKDFFDTETKLTQKFLGHRKENANLSATKEFKELKKTTDSLASSLFLKKEEIEDAILRQKDLIKTRNFVSDQPEKKGIVESIKEGISNIKEQVSSVIHREAPREPAHTQTQGTHGLVEGMTHYSG